MGRHGIRANSAVPGITDTPDVRRAIQVEQTDKVLVDRAARPHGVARRHGASRGLMLSDAAAYVTGQILSINGGLTAGFFTR